MNPRPAPLLFASLLVLPLLLAGCGNKGPLVMPETTPVETDAELSGNGVPVEIAAPAPGLQVDGTEPQPPARFDPFHPPIDPATVPDTPHVPADADADAAPEGNG